MIRRLRQLIRFVRVALAARTIQDDLWGVAGLRTYDGPETWEMWLEALEKRLKCLQKIDASNKHWRIETRKRLLQLSTCAVGMMESLDTRAISPPSTNPYLQALGPDAPQPTAILRMLAHQRAGMQSIPRSEP